MLNCRALLPDVKVVARGKKVDFGTISVGVERETRVTLSNLGMHTRAVFDASVDPPSMSTTIGLQVSPAQAAAAVSSGAALAKRIASANPTSNATSVVFHVAPDHGELAPGEEVAIRVSFLPLDAVEYAEDELPLVVDGEPYVNLSLRGEGIHPHLSFSTNRVVLPSVPLEVTATAHFHVHATGYDHLELTCRVPLDTTRAPLTVLFPRGKTLSMACPSLPVELRFASNTSVAFNARLGFFDADGNSFALSVADCAENCLLTNYNFIQKQGLAPKLMDDGSSSSPRHSHQRK
ncbi:hypothetical protein PF002_g17080 [Phytophthora fragariae]|uniref:Abnormal spindle-like microcephaly-associated protein ASH domain-containing protein n=1 Tax=Phytophthora fragariae TaxID=53985 RepID=A0A6A3YEZ4_9STRA|nr:hypothetical protein PF002_g17080 [Phytophthora fragariae]